MGQIISIEAYNAFGIKAQVVHPKQFNVIQGGNATGKTSWLDIINVGLFNNNPRHDVIMIGENEAIIKFKTDDGLEVERHLFNDGRSDKLQVKINGEVQQGPQTLLNNLFGLSDKKKETISVNPVELMFKLKGKGRTDKERSEIILSTIPMYTLDENWSILTFGKVLPINYVLHDLIICKEAEKYYYDVRRDANNIVEDTENQVAALQKQLPENYVVEEWESTDLIKLSNDIHDADKINNFRIQGQEIIDNIASTKEAIINKYELELKNLDTKYAGLVEEAKSGVIKEKDDLDLKIEGLKTRAANSVKAINEQIDTLKNDTIIRRETINKDMAELEKQIALLKQELGQLDGNLETAIKTKEAEITNTNETLKLSIENVKNEIKSVNERVNVEVEGIDGKKVIEVQNINNLKDSELKTEDDRVANAIKYLTENPEIEIEPLKDKHESAVKMMGFVEMAHNLQTITERLETENATAKKYDDFVKLCRKKPQELLKTVDVPFEGFEIDDDGIVRINGQHLENFNTQAMMDICVRVAKHYIKDAKEKIICLDKLECFDPVERAEFENKCRADAGYQYFTTYVIPEIDADKLKSENPELYEKYKNSMELTVVSK